MTETQKQINELQAKMQALRDALIEIKAIAWANKGEAITTLMPKYTSDKLEEIETTAQKALDKNRIYA